MKPAAPGAPSPCPHHLNDLCNECIELGESISDLRSNLRHIARTAEEAGPHTAYRYDLAAAIAEIFPGCSLSIRAGKITCSSLDPQLRAKGACRMPFGHRRTPVRAIRCPAP